MNLTPKAIKNLERNGWFPNRAVDIREAEMGFKKLGLPMLPQAAQFLTGFLGLGLRMAVRDLGFEIEYPPDHVMTEEDIDQSENYFVAAFDVSPKLLVAKFGEQSRTQWVVNKIKHSYAHRFSWLGYHALADQFLIVDELGNYFSSEGFVYAHLGNSAEEMLNNLVENKFCYTRSLASGQSS